VITCGLILLGLKIANSVDSWRAAEHLTYSCSVNQTGSQKGAALIGGSLTISSSISWQNDTLQDSTSSTHRTDYILLFFERSSSCHSTTILVNPQKAIVCYIYLGLLCSSFNVLSLDFPLSHRQVWVYPSFPSFGSRPFHKSLTVPSPRPVCDWLVLPLPKSQFGALPPIQLF
jgi:hypothetical protein